MDRKCAALYTFASSAPALMRAMTYLNSFEFIVLSMAASIFVEKVLMSVFRLFRSVPVVWLNGDVLRGDIGFGVSELCAGDADRKLSETQLLELKTKSEHASLTKLFDYIFNCSTCR